MLLFTRLSNECKTKENIEIGFHRILSVFTFLSDHCIDLFGWQFQETVERKLNWFCGKYLHKINIRTLQYLPCFHADKIAAKPLLKCRLNNKPKLWKNNTKILKCQTKRKKGKKEFEIVFLSKQPDEIFTRAEMPNNAIYYSIITSLKRQLLCYSGVPIQCTKTYPKSQYSNRKALNLILDHQRM